ncbi:MAG: hypothetical protein GF353_26765, partial [Candidatus Lokiarchaeota archaeon]|nr:hypothetical protein [Candidatus Lokiarchaeota archaeon]
MNEDNLNSSNNENSKKEDSNQNPQENVTEKIDNENQIFRKDAIELEQMAVTLIDKGMYNESISLLRKAIALLVQINDELKADEVRKKLSEVYILQQQKGSQETPSSIPKKGPPKKMRIEEKVEKRAEEDIRSEPKLATEEQKKKELIVSEDKKEGEILREPKEIREREETEETERYTELEEKTDIAESEVNRAYELIDQGIELEKSSNIEDAIKVYEQAARLFEKIHYKNVLNNVKSKISELKEKRDSESKLEKKSIEAQQKKAPESLENIKEESFETEEYKMEFEKESLIKEDIPPEQPQELDKTTETIKTVEERYKREIEDEIFQNEITKMVDKAQKMEYNYEIEKKKSIKNKRLFKVKEPYTEILEIYETVKEKLLKRGWNEQASVYTDQINIIQGKLKQDKRLREIETKKIQKQKEYEESIKANNITPQEDIDKLKAVEEKYHKQFEEEEFGKQIADIVDEAEKLAHEYEIAMRKGKFEEKSPY